MFPSDHKLPGGGECRAECYSVYSYQIGVPTEIPGLYRYVLNSVRTMYADDDREVHEMSVVVAIANHHLRNASIRSRHSIGQFPVNPKNAPNW